MLANQEIRYSLTGVRDEPVRSVAPVVCLIEAAPIRMCFFISGERSDEYHHTACDGFFVRAALAVFVMYFASDKLKPNKDVQTDETISFFDCGCSGDHDSQS